MIAVKKNLRDKERKDLYSIAGFFFEPSVGNARCNNPFSGHFIYSPNVESIIEGEMIDKCGVSYFAGKLDKSKNELKFTKFYATSTVDYDLKKNGPRWEGNYSLNGKKDNVECRIIPLLKGDVRDLQLSSPANKIYRELIRKASKSK